MDRVDKIILEALQKRISQHDQKERKAIERSRKECEGLKTGIINLSTTPGYPEASTE